MAVNKNQLLSMLNQSSFALYDAILYLDTHPEDQTALEYYRYYKNLRNQAMEAYENAYGPMQNDHVSASNRWQWISGKWPWEGGSC